MNDFKRLNDFEKLLINVIKKVIKWFRYDEQILDDEIINFERMIDKTKDSAYPEVVVNLRELISSHNFDIKDIRERIGILKGLIGIIDTEIDKEE